MKYTILFLCFFFLPFFSNAQNKTSKPKMVKAYFLNQKIKATLLCKAKPLSSDEADRLAILSIHEALIGAEKEPKFLELNLLLSNAPIQKELFVFAIESETPKDLKIEVFDEEDFQMVLQCFFNIPKRGAFYAIDAEYIEDGGYHLRLTDDDGAELNRQIKITRK